MCINTNLKHDHNNFLHKIRKQCTTPGARSKLADNCKLLSLVDCLNALMYIYALRNGFYWLFHIRLKLVFINTRKIQVVIPKASKY